MPEKYVVAIDLGTSAARAVLFDFAARPLWAARWMPATYSRLQPGWSEQEPEEIVAAVIQCLGESPTSSPAPDCVCDLQLANVQHPCAGSRWPRRDQLHHLERSSGVGIAETLRTREGFRELVSATGCPISEIFPLYKILWLKQNPGGVLQSQIRFHQGLCDCQADRALSLRTGRPPRPPGCSGSPRKSGTRMYSHLPGWRGSPIYPQLPPRGISSNTGKARLGIWAICGRHPSCFGWR